MRLRDIAIGNLRRRKAKALFVLTGLVVGVATAVALVSLVQTLRHDINHKLEMYGANILVTPKTENLSLSYGGLSLGGVSFDMKEIREEQLEKIRDIKNAGNVAAVGPMLLGAVAVGSGRVLLAGVDFQAMGILRPWWSFKGALPTSDGLVAGSEAARVMGLQAGSEAVVNGRSIPVTAVLEKTGSQDDGLLFVPLALAQTILKKEGLVSMAEVAALCTGCPIPEMVEQISGVLPGADVMAIQQVVKGRMETLGQFEKFSYGISALVLFVGGLMVLVTMTGSIRERTVEIGIFRAMGFRRKDVVRIVLIEASIVSFLAGILGYALGFFATKGLAPFMTTSEHVMVPFDPVVAGVALALALALGLLSSAYPAMLASRLDPNEALRAL
jgi:putative ABC transport system permease protein